MDAAYVKKLQDDAIKQDNKDLVLAKRRKGKLQKNAYSSILDALHKIGVYINRDALSKRVEQEIKIKHQLKCFVMKQLLNFLVLLKMTTML